MFDTIELEFKGVIHKMSFQRPTHRHKRQYMHDVIPLSKLASTLENKTKTNPDSLNSEEVFKIMDQLAEARFRILLDLHDKTYLKKLDDFLDIADEDLTRLISWLETKIGATRTEEQSSFLKK